MKKLYLTGAIHQLSSERADELVTKSDVPCVKRWTVQADYDCYVAYLSETPRQPGQRDFALTIEEYRKFCDPLKWSRDYRIYEHLGKVEFATMSLNGNGSQFGITGLEPQLTLGM